MGRVVVHYPREGEGRALAALTRVSRGHSGRGSSFFLYILCILYIKYMQMCFRELNFTKFLNNPRAFDI